jgi:hypothetical protein
MVSFYPWSGTRSGDYWGFIILLSFYTAGFLLGHGGVSSRGLHLVEMEFSFGTPGFILLKGESH